MPDTGSGASTLNPDAQRFVNDMMVTPTLMQDYIKALRASKQSDPPSLANITTFLVGKGYATATAQNVTAALAQLQRSLPAWAGTYTTKTFDDATKKQASGPALSILPQVSGPAKIGLDKLYLIESVFDDNQLVWVKTDSGGDAVNDSAGNLVFKMTNLKNGSVVRSFTGAISQADNVTLQIAGTESSGEPDVKAVPPDSNVELLKTTAVIASAAVAVIGLSVTVLTLWKGKIEISKLKLEITKLTRENNTAAKAEAEKKLAAEQAEAAAVDPYVEQVGDAADADAAAAAALPADQLAAAAAQLQPGPDDGAGAGGGGGDDIDGGAPPLPPEPAPALLDAALQDEHDAQPGIEGAPAGAEGIAGGDAAPDDDDEDDDVPRPPPPDGEVA